MSEFVECQNCGRKFFAENIDCPYCGDREDVDDLIRDVQGSPPRSRLREIMLFAYQLVLVGIILFALWGWQRTESTPMRIFLVAEAVYAGILLWGLWTRKYWARWSAIAFILANALIAILALFVRDRFGVSFWGPGPLTLLIFVFPFIGPYARRR